MTALLTPTGPALEVVRRHGWATAPVLSTLAMLVAMFLHVGVADLLPNNFFVMMMGLVVIATAVWLDRNPTRLHIGAVEWVLGVYLLWNILSMFSPHKYVAGNPLTGEVFSVPRFIMTAAVIPFVLYVVGRYTFEREAVVRIFLWAIVVAAGYSAGVSILQFNGPTNWVWPRFIVDGSLMPVDKTWTDRAVGVFNQPVVNGFIMVLGFAVAMLLISRRSEPTVLRWFAFVTAVACGYGTYLTHTRAAWLSGAVVLVVGALLAKGYRKGFIVALGLAGTVVAVNWSTFTSSDRNAGGVSSESELIDRLNLIKTAQWAFAQEPVTGWGIQRFQALNTYHHQQWSPEVPWMHGYGIVSHSNELGILAELGLIGLGLWLAAALLIAYRLRDAYRTLPDNDLCGKPLVVTAIAAFAALFCAGLTVDLRLFDFPTAIVFLLVGTAIGWRDRHQQPPAPAEDVATGMLSPRHG